MLVADSSPEIQKDAMLINGFHQSNYQCLNCYSIGIANKAGLTQSSPQLKQKLEEKLFAFQDAKICYHLVEKTKCNANSKKGIQHKDKLGLAATFRCRLILANFCLRIIECIFVTYQIPEVVSDPVH